MNWESFSAIGYVGVLLSAAVPLFWLMHRLRRRGRWLCPAALLLAVGALVLAKVNSEEHVNRIGLDRSAQMAERQAQEEARLRAAEAGREGEVAQIRFAEDGSADFLDRAGMDEADLKYLDKLNQSSEPEWKKEKKSRSREGAAEDDLESLLGAEESVEGVESESLDPLSEREQVLMSESDLAMAHRLDGLNLSWTRFLVLLAVLVVGVDYLRRANIYAEAGFPLPLPSAWTNSLTPIPPVVVRPERARRSMEAELAWLARRGDAFVYVTEDSQAAAAVPDSLPRFGKKGRPVDVLHVATNDISDDFIFEALWYGRSCFVVDSTERADRMMGRFLELLEERKKVRAHLSQTAHIVWDAKQALPESKTMAFERLAKATGFSLFMCRDGKP